MSLSTEIAGKFSLEGRIAVVTGAGSGLGQGTAIMFAKAGASVVLADIDAQGLEATAALVREAGGTAIIKPTDVSSRDDMEALADAAAGECGGLDIWVNSAGITLWSDVISATAEQAEKVVAVNMMGTYWGCAAAGRVMKEHGGGAIINISSTAGDSPVPTLSVYGMTKAAVNHLTRVCAKEFGPADIRVNCVIPGWIDTPINNSMCRNADGEYAPEMRDDLINNMASLSPLGMTGEASDIAFAVLYLASDASRFVTGELLRVSGGV